MWFDSFVAWGVGHQGCLQSSLQLLCHQRVLLCVCSSDRSVCSALSHDKLSACQSEAQPATEQLGMAQGAVDACQSFAEIAALDRLLSHPWQTFPVCWAGVNRASFLPLLSCRRHHAARC